MSDAQRSPLDGVLVESGLADSVTANDLIAAIEVVLRTSPVSQDTDEVHDTLSYLSDWAGIDSSVIAGWTPEAENALRARSAASTAALIAQQTLSRAEAADRLGRSVSRIGHLIRDEHLYAIRQADKVRIPSWQIVDGELLPGLRQVVPYLVKTRPEPVGLASLMAQQPEEYLAGRTPVAYLLAGGDPGRVIEIVESWLRQ